MPSALSRTYAGMMTMMVIVDMIFNILRSDPILTKDEFPVRMSPYTMGAATPGAVEYRAQI